MKKINKYLLMLAIFSGISISYAKSQDTISVSVRPNVRKDMIQLRWAATSPTAWRYTNKNGVTIERYTITRDGKMLSEPEKNVLVATPLKPAPLNDWQIIATSNTYAAVIAQALYGDTFEVSGGKKGIAEIIATSQEQEQRFAMSLYAADMSYQAALFAGWGYEDKTAVKGEKYLYRITPVSDGSNVVIEQGSAYIGLDDYYDLPKPQEFNAIFGNGTVMFSWNYTALERFYNAYYLERSENGKTFTRTTQMPLTNISGTDRMLRSDSITNGKKYYYRIVGITPFGDESPFSDVISGKGVNRLIYVPHITKAIPNEKNIIVVEWEFDPRGNGDITSFELQRSDTDKGPYKTVISDIKSSARSVLYKKPQAENYLRISAIAKEGEPVNSFPFLLQIPDSIPPAVPKGLEGYVDTIGVAHIKWRANTDEDILGYRIFRGQTEGEELVPLTDIAVTDTFFIDTVSVRNLNPKVFYAVSALDKRYNQSAACKPVAITKPLLIPPSAPYITKFEATPSGVVLNWVTGRIDIITGYEVYRGDSVIAKIDNGDTKEYTDKNTKGGNIYEYSVVAVNTAGLKSEHSPEISVKAKFIEKTGEKIESFSADNNDKSILLKWKHNIGNVRNILIYRKTDKTQLTLWQQLAPNAMQTADNDVKINTQYEYLLVIKDMNGKAYNKQAKINH